jgi:hypothetical protein
MIWFVHASTGSDSNVGWRSDAPFLTLAKLATVMAPGDRAYLAGTFRENVTFSGGLVDCYIGQWPGQTKYVVRGDTVITGFSASGAGYTKNIGLGISVRSVVVNWDTRVNQNGLHYGHLTLRADAATALATANSWYYERTTGLLSINTGANPSTQTVAYCNGGSLTVTGWTNISGNIYEATVGTGWTFVSATSNRSVNLAAGTFGSLTANQYAYSGDKFRVNIGSNPASAEILAYVAGGNGFNIGNATNCVVDNFKGALWTDDAPGRGYALIGYGTGNVFRIDRTDDCGYHHVGFVGGACSYNTIEPSTGGEGVCAGNASGGITLVFYTDTASQTGNVGRNLRIWASPFLLSDGTTGAHSGSIGGVYSHTNGVQVLDGVTWQNIRVTYPYAVGAASSAMYAAHTTAPTAAALDRDDPASYRAKFIDCKVDGSYCPGIVVGAKGSALYQRCSLKCIGTTRNQSPNAVFMSTNDAERKQVLFDACEIIMNLDGASTSLGFKPWNEEDFLFLNCSVVDIGTGSNTRHWFFANYMGVAPNNTVCLYGRQSIWFYTSTNATTRSFINNDGLATNTSGGQDNGVVPRDFVDCVYGNISAGNFSSAAAFNTEAEWTSAVDATARYETTSPFEEPSVHCRLKRSHALWTHRDTSSTSNTALGINGKNWTGTLGCYQLNAAATTNWPALTDSPPPARRRPAVWINCQTGATTNPFRIRQDLFDDPETYINAVFTKAGTAGIDVIFYVPNGHNGTHYYSAAAPSDLPNQIKDTITMMLDKWQYEYGVSHIGVYLGAVWYTEQGSSSPVKSPMFADWEDEAVAAVFDPWRDIGVDTYGFDAIANRGSDQYSTPVKDIWNTLGGFCYHVCGMLPMGEAIEVDNPVTTTEFDADMAARSEYMIVDTLYTASAPSDFSDVLDGTLPARVGFHWLYFAAEYAAVGTSGAQARVNQGYIVNVYEDASQAVMNWVGSQAANSGTPGSGQDANSGTSTDTDPPVPPPPPVDNRGRRSRRSSRSTRSQTGV